MQLDGNTFTGNYATSGGGGAYLEACGGPVTITGNTFTGNHLTGVGTLQPTRAFFGDLGGAGLVLSSICDLGNSGKRVAADDGSATQSGNRFEANVIDAGESTGPASS